MSPAVKTTFLNLSLLIGATLLLVSVASHLILTIDFYENSGELVSEIPAQNLRVYQSLQQWIYVATVIYIMFKLSVISSILYTALYLAGQAVSLNRVFNIVVTAEYVFLVPAMAKITLFHFNYPEGTLLEWHRFYILSALSLFPKAPADWFYALQTVNVFEIVYWFILAFGIYKITSLSFDLSLRVVVSSYLPALFIWVCTITFCSLVMFPSTG